MTFASTPVADIYRKWEKLPPATLFEKGKHFLDIVSVTYYSLSGMEISLDTHGMAIQKIRYGNGNIRTKKIILNSAKKLH